MGVVEKGRRRVELRLVRGGRRDGFSSYGGGMSRSKESGSVQSVCILVSSEREKERKGKDREVIHVVISRSEQCIS